LEFERSVLDPFRIESAVSGEVDVLEENAEHCAGNGCPGMSSVDRDDGGILLAATGEGDRQEYQHNDREPDSFAHTIAPHIKAFA
jgi:hypothetical protein